MATSASSSSIGMSASAEASEESSSHVSTPATGNLVLSLRAAFANEQVALILASQSPRRQEILTMMGLKGRGEELLFTTIPSPLNETALQEELARENRVLDPKNYTRILAEEKARALAESLGPVAVPTLILGSDTIVDQGNVILEKPKDKADAARMLLKLSAAEHYVHTGVAFYRCLPATGDGGSSPPEKMVSFVDTATVAFAPLAEADIQAYIATGEPMDKAGSYGIQGIGGQFVRHVQGDFFTVSVLRVDDCVMLWLFVNHRVEFVPVTNFTLDIPGAGNGSPHASDECRNGLHCQAKLGRRLVVRAGM